MGVAVTETDGRLELQGVAVGADVDPVERAVGAGLGDQDGVVVQRRHGLGGEAEGGGGDDRAVGALAGGGVDGRVGESAVRHYPVHRDAALRGGRGAVAAGDVVPGAVVRLAVGDAVEGRPDPLGALEPPGGRPVAVGVAPELEVQVRMAVRGLAVLADLADHRAPPHRVTGRHGAGLQMEVRGEVAPSVIDLDHVARVAMLERLVHPARGGGDQGGPFGAVLVGLLHHVQRRGVTPRVQLPLLAAGERELEIGGRHRLAARRAGDGEAGGERHGDDGS